MMTSHPSAWLRFLEKTGVVDYRDPVNHNEARKAVIGLFLQCFIRMELELGTAVFDC